MDLYKELLDFLEELKNYREEVLIKTDSKLLSEYKLEYEELRKLMDKSWAVYLEKYPLLQKLRLKISEEESKEEYREKLVLKHGALKDEIAKLIGRTDINQFNRTWNRALSPVFGIGVNKDALSLCIDYTLEAIGKLESDINEGIRDKQGNHIKRSGEFISDPPMAFIAHGGTSGVLNKLREFVEALGIKPIIVELSPTKGMSVDDKVNKYIKDADFGIVLATKGGIVDTKGKKSKQHPRLNVIDEIERLRAVFPDKTILLLEKGVNLPSNISGLTYEPFARQSMDRAFTAIARELTEMKILKAVKPQKEEQKV